MHHMLVFHQLTLGDEVFITQVTQEIAFIIVLQQMGCN
jgi:hypothetical protein